MIDTLREYLEIMFFPYIEKKTLLRIVFIILLEPPLLSESLFKYFKPYMVFFNLMLKKNSHFSLRQICDYNFCVDFPHLCLFDNANNKIQMKRIYFYCF